jgi:ketosteroid isomerase-like protein
MKSIAIATVAMALATTVCIEASAKATLPKSDMDNQKRMARVWFEEAFVKENLAPLDDILAEDVVMYMDPSYPSKVTNTTKLTGRDQVKQHVKNVNDAAELTGNIKAIIGEGDTVMLDREVTMKLANGTSKDVPWVTIFKFKNGKVSEITHVHDTLHEANQMKSTAQ